MTEAVLDMEGTQKKESSRASANNNNQLTHDILGEGGNVPLDLKQAFILPAWYDEQKFKRGQKFFYDNYFSVFVGNLCGLILVLAVPTILKILIMTGQSSTPLKAFHRYLDTISHMLEWYDGGLQNPNSRASKSLLNIRARHYHATKRASKAGYSPISQRDMALTQFGFMGLVVLRQKELGIKGSQKDLEGFIHFWRVVGYLLGIKDKYNLCRGDLTTTKDTCQSMLDQVYNVLLSSPTAEFEHMTKVMLEGMWAINPFINPEAFLTYTKHMCGLECATLPNFYSRTLFNMQVYIHSVLLNSIFALILRPIFNFNMWFAIFMAQRVPYLAFFAFGRNLAPPQQFTIKSSPVVEQ